LTDKVKESMKAVDEAVKAMAIMKVAEAGRQAGGGGGGCEC
jgi:hypothetical protein